MIKEVVINEGVVVEEVVTKKVDTAQPVQHTLPCEMEGCGYIIQKDGDMPLYIAVGFLKLHQDLHDRGYKTFKPWLKQLVHNEKGDIKPVHTAQPA